MARWLVIVVLLKYLGVTALEFARHSGPTRIRTGGSTRYERVAVPDLATGPKAFRIYTVVN